MSARNVRHGGLMRCCLTSIAEYTGPEEPGVTVIGCLYHKDPNEPVSKLAEDGIGEWAQPRPARP